MARTCRFCRCGCCVGRTERTCTGLVASQGAEAVVGIAREVLWHFSIEPGSNEHCHGCNAVVTHIGNDDCVYTR